MKPTDLPVDGPHSAEELVARATWDAVERGQLLGLTHALGNSAHAIELLTACLTPGGEVPVDIVAAFREDGTRYAELVALYRLLPFAGDDPPEAGTAGDSIAQAVRLFQHHALAKDAVCHVTTTPGVPAIYAPPAAMVQALLVLLACSVREDSGATTAAIDVDGDPETARIHLRFPASSQFDADRAVIAAKWLLRTAAASVIRSDAAGQTSLLVTLPSLARARRM